MLAFLVALFGASGLKCWSPPQAENRREHILGSRKRNWRGMPTRLGVTFWGSLKPWKDKAEKFAIKIRHRNSLRNSPAIFLKLAKIKISPQIRSPERQAQQDVGRRQHTKKRIRKRPLKSMSFLYFVAKTKGTVEVELLEYHSTEKHYLIDYFGGDSRQAGRNCLPRPIIMRCAKGICAKGFEGLYEVFPFAVGKRV